MKIESQLIDYNEKKGLFGFRGSLATYQTRPPVTWWEQYGDDTPELKAFAVKVLGLTCSASACERNWSTFNQVHTKRRNRLNTKRMNDLVFIMYNKKLKQKFLKKADLKEEDDPLLVENVMSDDEWIGDPNDTNENNIGGGRAGDERGGEVGDERGGRESEERGARLCRGEVGSSSRKRKSVQMNLIDEDDDVEVLEVGDDDEDCEDDPFDVDNDNDDAFYAV
ncbi:hypothetical protein QVD17_16510 [Tagetes erecta]|uniref:HAT C-terminal dimerisation domain-containing protein n=1 Tax=Tagetes erecta TaxID=13708 RepID=A0AAD8NTL8_TARER|nr:hypothetical protein QVD17_16510 [Tagetes erecta]